MAKIIHTADLHLKTGDEKAYCFSVLDEIIALAITEKAEFLIISGDIFDSFPDFVALRAEFAKKVTSPGSFRTICIPGNHEALRSGGKDLGLYDLPGVEFKTAKPFSVADGGDVEFICVPHAEDYDNYRDWPIPAKQPGKARILMIHGLNSTIYTGPEEEGEARAGVIDDGLFTGFAPDYAALGHIHRPNQNMVGGVTAAYPGSPRVWRASDKESGRRFVKVIETHGDKAPAIMIREIKAAGQYREYSLPLALDGSADAAAIEAIKKSAGLRDRLKIKLSGIVEDEKRLAETEVALKTELSGSVRILEIERGDITPCAEISSNPLAQNFLELLDRRKPPEGDQRQEQVWLLARQAGLKAIADKIGAGL